MMCSFSWKNIVVVVIAVLILQITYSDGEKGECGFEKFDEDQGNDCCFYEPECTPKEIPKPIEVWQPYVEMIWKTRNFTRPIEECEVGENKTVCFPFKKNVCKSRILPGTCATVSYLVHTITRCPPDYILYNETIHTPLNSYSTADGPRRSRLSFSSERKDNRGSKSIESNNFDNENDNAGDDDDNCCHLFSLDLTNEIKTKHIAREGSYIRGSEIINGFKSWISSNGKSAIWYIKENVWCIGDVDNMSTSLCSIHSTVDVSCPAEIKGEQWKFFVNGEFQNVGSSSDLNLICHKGRTKRALVGHEKPHGHPGAGLCTPGQPGCTARGQACTPGQPGCGVAQPGCVEGDVGCTGHHDNYGVTIAPIPNGCFEVSQYRSQENCCDFPDKICEEVWLHKCETGPQITCTWVDHQTCQIIKEPITKHKPITVKGPVVVVDVCIPKYWCKVCEGKPAKQCYKNQEDYPTTNVH